MILIVLLAAAGIWGLGIWLRTPVQARLIMLALLYVAVLFFVIALPSGHPLRENLGGGPAPWLVAGALAAAIAVYAKVIRRVRGHAAELEAERETEAPPPSTGPFSNVELERYARHIVLREVGGPGQKRLKDARVLVIGAGGLGAPALLYLAAAGVGTIGVIDDDTVDLSNLQRQIIHADERIGMPKVFSAEQGMKAVNPHITVRPYQRRLTPEIAEDLIGEYDLVLDGSDSFITRDIVNRACVATGRPLVGAAITQWEGQITVYDPAAGAPCYACLFPEEPAAGLAPSCAEAGVIGALPGLVGSAMALEAIKLITGAGTPLRGALLLWDGLDADARRVKVARRADCKVCGDI